MKTMKKHIFVICAYKESPFLEECIESTLNQSVTSEVIVSTSTPNEYIQSICDKYGVKLYVNTGEKGITQDWNFAYSVADAEYVTIAHQDDVYDENYLSNVLGYMKKAKDPIIFFSDYGELRDGEKVYKSSLLTIKRLMLLPLRYKSMWNKVFVRRRVLSMGNPICCPSITFNKDKCPAVPFENHFISNEDWQAWEKLSKKDGAFVYCSKVLMFHRIHRDSTTSMVLDSNGRTKEDFEMFSMFWPRWIASILTKVYGRSEKSNNI